MTLNIRLIVDQGRRWWLKLKYHPILNRIRDERESRAWLKKHGPIVKIAPMPRTPDRPRQPRRSRPKK